MAAVFSGNRICGYRFILLWLGTALIMLLGTSAVYAQENAAEQELVKVSLTCDRQTV